MRVEIERTVVLGAGVALLPFVLLAGRRFLRDFGVLRPLREGAAWIVRQCRARAAAAVPVLVLVGCLAAALAFAGAGGRFSRPVAGEGMAAATLVRTANLSAETRFVGFTRRSLEPDRGDDGDRTSPGVVGLVLDNDAPLGAGLVLGAVAAHFGGGSRANEFRKDRQAQEVAVRVALAVGFCLAALLAYLSLVRLLGRRWLALGATLLAFSAFSGGAWDAVSLEGSPALAGFLLAFHGMVGFVREGRFGRFLVQYAAGAFLSFSVAALALPFAAAGLFGEMRRRRATALSAASASSAGMGGGGGRSPGPPAGPVRNRYLVFGAFALLSWGAVVGLNRANEWALAAGGARLIAADRGSDSARAPAAAGAPVDGSPVWEGSGRAPGPGSGPAPVSRPGREALRRAAGALVPYAALPRGGGADEPRGTLPLTLAALAGLVLVPVGAALSRQRRLLLPLALSGFLLEIGPFRPGAGAPLDPSAHLGLALALFSLLGLAAAGFGEGRWSGTGRAPARALRISSALAVGLAAGVFLLSGHRAGAVASDPVESVVAPGFEERVSEDFRRIRARLRRREGAVFVPAALREVLGGADATAWRLVGSVLAERPATRGLAEFVLTGRREPRPGLLTPDNREVFLYHRAAFDGELDRMIAAAGAPQVRGEYDLHLDRRQALFVREGCRPEDREGLFVLHLDPVDRRDLPPHRRHFGFGNHSFRFPDRALDLGERCVARVALPGYRVRRFVVAHHPDRRYEDWIWYHEVRPDDAATDDPDQE